MMKALKYLCLLMTGLLASTNSIAESPEPAGQAETLQPQPAPCSAAEYRQFDFWLGSWTAYDADGERRLGTNQLTPLLNGCGMMENWSNQGYEGTSVNFYDAESGTWHQTWIDNQGGHLFLQGGQHEQGMRLSGERLDEDGATVIDRITWTPLADGRVRQFWEVSKDQGQSWETAFDGYYQRDSEASP